MDDSVDYFSIAHTEKTFHIFSDQYLGLFGSDDADVLPVQDISAVVELSGPGYAEALAGEAA